MRHDSYLDAPYYTDAPNYDAMKVCAESCGPHANYLQGEAVKYLDESRYPDCSVNLVLVSEDSTGDRFTFIFVSDQPEAYRPEEQPHTLDVALSDDIAQMEGFPQTAKDYEDAVEKVREFFVENKEVIWDY